MCNRDGFQPKRKNLASFVLPSNRGCVFYGFGITQLSKLLLKIDVGKDVIPELGQLCKQISIFYEIDIESQKENGYG